MVVKTRAYKEEATLEGLVAKKLIKGKKTLAIAESCTGGLLSKCLTDVPGSSKFIKLNIIAYSNEAKINVLEVPIKVIKNYGAVSSQTAAHMAAGIKKLAKSTYGFSITGIAGPSGGSKEKPVGLVYFGFVKGNKVKTKKVFFDSSSSRKTIRFLATQFALSWLKKAL